MTKYKGFVTRESIRYGGVIGEEQMDDLFLPKEEHKKRRDTLEVFLLLFLTRNKVNTALKIYDGEMDDIHK